MIKACERDGDKNTLDDLIKGLRELRAKTAGLSDTDGNGKIGALLEILEIFAKRELGCRMKKRAAEKAVKKGE